MPIYITWPEITLRLGCALLAGGAIGLNRTEHGRPAGLRTSILVCLAACVAMIQVNLLLPLAGRAPNSFVMNDLMRLPLGILSGMGFIGAGAIVRRDHLVAGITTAATMWFLTVLGLCFGGGQVSLGIAGAVLGVVILTGLKHLEGKMKQDHQARLQVVTTAGGPDENEIRAVAIGDGFTISSCAYVGGEETGRREWNCELHWHAETAGVTIPPFVHRLAARQGVARVAWTPGER
jgi:putative Mg2+ transporter-C (MgtC) family protein